MADDDPWAAYLTPTAPTAPVAAPPAAQDDQWAQYVAPTAPAPPASKAWAGSILPVSSDAQGNVSFDPHAGILAPFTKANDVMGQVATGQLDPTSPQAVQSMNNLALAVSPATPGLRSGVGLVPGAGQALSPGVVNAPTADALHAAASSAYKQARDLGVDYSPLHVGQLAQGIQTDLYDKGLLPVSGIAPATHAVLDQLQQTPDVSQIAGGSASVPLTSIIAARQSLGHIASNFNAGPDQVAAASAKRALDSFVASPPEGAVLAGPANQASGLLNDANSNWAAAARSDSLNGIERAASLRSSAVNSGANVGNATRQRVASLLLNDKASAGFNPDEIAGLESVVKGSPTSNALRTAANKLGGGGGLASTIVSGAGMGIGAHLGGEAGAVLGGTMAHSIGPALKSAQNNLDTKALSTVDEAVRNRSALAEALKGTAPPVVQQYAKTNALARALMLDAQKNQAPQWKPGQVWNPAAPLSGGSI